MNYVKKMCILRQIKQGFSGDGKLLSGLIKIEQYGKNLAVEVSIINFAPLVSGEYYCLLSDGRGKTEMLSLRGKSIFNILSDLDISAGFCGIICYVKTEVVPIAYGINGNGSYDWRSILGKALPPVFPKKEEKAEGEIAKTVATIEDFEEIEPSRYEMTENSPENIPYDDEAVAKENYYEVKDERIELSKTDENANAESKGQAKAQKSGADVKENENDEGVLPSFKVDTDGYYRSVKRELDDLFSRYPQDKTLSAAFQRSEWVRLRGSANDPKYLVGALYRDGKAEYICYALSAEEGEAPPEEIKSVCAFVPVSPLVGAKGFFVIFQSASTGECIKPTRV